MHSNKCGNTSGQEYHANEAEKKFKCKSLCVEIR